MKSIHSAIIAGLLALIAGHASAEDKYPDHAIKMIVPFTPGGIVDNIARIVGAQMQVRLGQPIVIENRAGAGGAIGTDFVARAPSDGYTLLLVSPGHAVAPLINKAVRYDPVHDFRAIGGIGIVPNVIVVNPNVPVKTMKEFMAYAKTKEVTYGTAGKGTSNHLSGELLAQMGGLKLTHVPYKGQPEAVNDLLAGQIEMMPLTTALAASQIKAGKLRGLAVTTAKRATALPDLPTVAESANLPGYEVGTWFGIVGPAKMPDAVVRRLGAELSAVLAMPDIKAKLVAMGMEMAPQSPEEFDRYIAQEHEKWGKVLAAAGIQPE